MSQSSGKFRLLWVFMQGQRRRYFGAVASMLLATLLMYLVPLVGAAMIDFVIQAKQTHAPAWMADILNRTGGLWGCLPGPGADASARTRSLLLGAGAIVVLTAAAGLFNYLKGRWTAKASETIARRLRDRLYDHLQQLPCSYHDRADTGDLVQRCTSDVETVRSFLAFQVIEIGRAVLMLLTVLPFMLALSPGLTALALAMSPVIVGFSAIFLKRVTAAFKLSDEAEGRMTAVLQENLTGIRVVRAFARQDYECRKFAVANDEFRDKTIRLIDMMAWYWSASDYTCHLQAALVLVMGGFWVLNGSADVGVLFAFVAYEGMLLWPIRQMGRLLTEAGKARVSLGRLWEILNRPDEQGHPAPAAVGAAGVVPGQIALAAPRPAESGLRTSDASPAIRGDLCVRDLHFSFDSQREVLCGVSFDAPAGATVALLGPSGSGKLTLIHLLLRLYPYERGSITIDGRELREMDLHSVRGQMGVVLQEPFLYSKTLRENIGLGAKVAGRGGGQRHSGVPVGPSDDALHAAASAAAIHESILSFEKGYDTLVGERGVTLSGGQRQRVALARAILRDPPILILDDALSAVDVQTEAAILSALGHRHGRRTTLVIAHRLSTLMQADRILVLEHGRIVQSGTHEQLLAAEGLYGRLWRIESALEEDLRQELVGPGQDGSPGPVDGGMQP